MDPASFGAFTLATQPKLTKREVRGLFAYLAPTSQSQLVPTMHITFAGTFCFWRSIDTDNHHQIGGPVTRMRVLEASNKKNVSDAPNPWSHLAEDNMGDVKKDTKLRQHKSERKNATGRSSQGK